MRTRIVYSCMPMIQNQKPVPVIQLEKKKIYDGNFR